MIVVRKLPDPMSTYTSEDPNGRYRQTRLTGVPDVYHTISDSCLTLGSSLSKQ